MEPNQWHNVDDCKVLPNVKYGVLQSALRKTTERLAHELARPGNVKPQWSDFEWRVARAVSAMHGVSSLLSDTLRWEGPSGWEEFLRQQKAHTAARHPRIEELLRRIDGCSRAANICMVALKGAELYARGLYSPGERPMADVDLLVRTADVAGASRMLEALGFHESSSSSWKHKVFVPQDRPIASGLGEHANNYLKIELHEYLREVLPVDVAEVTQWVLRAQPVAGLNGYPSPAALMSHLLLHAAGAMANRALRLLHLHDLALLSSRMSHTDWQELLGYSASDQGHWWAWPPLHLTALYYTRAVPTHVLDALEASCPWPLRHIVRFRRLSDVSLSRLRIDAFPGIEWSQSVVEAMRYIRRRVRPGRQMLVARQQALRTQVAATESEWDRMSQGRRIVRWIVSQPVRTETLFNVRAALAQTE